MKNKIIKLLITIFLLINAQSCLSLNTSGSIRIESNPSKANVLLRGSSSEPLKIGETPLVIERRNVPDLFDDTTTISVEKPGYFPNTLIVPRSIIESKGSILISLKEIPSQGCDTEIAMGVARAQQFLSLKKFEEAQTLLFSLLNKYPNAPIIHDLIGNFYYLNKNSSKALEYYKRSLAIQPDNANTKKMVDRLSNIKNIMGD